MTTFIINQNTDTLEEPGPTPEEEPKEDTLTKETSEEDKIDDQEEE